MFNVFFNGGLFVISDEEEEEAITNLVESFRYSLDKEVVLGEIFELYPEYDPDKLTASVEKNWRVVIENARELRETYPPECFDINFFDATVGDFVGAYIEQGE